LYGPDALQRLMQIVLLKRSGFSLAQITALLSASTPVITDLLSERIASLERELADKARALQSLRAVTERVGSASTLDLDQLLESITMTNTLDLQLAAARRNDILERAEAFGVLQSPADAARTRTRVEQRLDALGPDGIEAAQRPWRELSADIRAAMAGALPASDTTVQVVQMHDGSTVRFRRLEEGYDPTNRDLAYAHVRACQARGEMATGLLFIDQNGADMHAVAKTVDTPLAELPFEMLCPGQTALQALMEKYR